MQWTLIWLAAGLATTSALHLTIGNSILEEVDTTGKVTESVRSVEEDNLINPREDTESVTDDAENSEEPTSESTSTTHADDNNEDDNEDNNGSTEPEEHPPSNEDEESASVSRSIETDTNESAVPDSEEAETEDAVFLVHTTSGPIQGQVWENNGNIISYIDIPYGIFESAFSSPIAAVRNEVVHDVKEHNKRCPQLDGDVFVGDRDCLTLSIFKPLNADNVPVLFHIHDGNFSTGSGNPAIYGPDYIVPKGVILILPNYRLGPLGFLCMMNETAPGNAGLKDLTLALNWLKENIVLFGGNPENIVVSGDGTSGALAGYLALSSKSTNYVTKVIVESGSVLSHWALDRNPLIAATELAEKISIFEGLEETEPSILVSGAQGIAFRPCVEHTTDGFLVETPWKIMHDETITKPFLIGSATHAGIHETLLQTEESVEEINAHSSLLLPDDLDFETDNEKLEIAEKVKAQYFGDRSITVGDVDDLTLCFTDAAYLGPGIRAARLLVESGATVFFYEFAFVGEFNRELDSILRPVQGAVMGDIVGYLFTQDGIKPTTDTDEHRMVETLTNLWTSFIHTGTPEAENVVWNKLEQTSDEEEEWLSIEIEPAMKKGLHLERLKLWSEIYDNHYVERNNVLGVSPSVFFILGVQIIVYLVFCANASHLF